LKLALILGGVIATIAAIAFSLLVFSAPKPIIEIHGEPLATVGPLDILNTLFSAWVIMAALLVVCFLAVRKIDMIPSGFYNFFESIIEGIYSFVTGIAGEQNGRRFFPLIATFFIYITFANWMSLTPIFNSIGTYVPLHAEEGEFHEDAVVFKDSGGISLIMPGSDLVELHAEDCAEGEEGDHCREAAIEAATEEHAAGDNEKLGVLFPYLRGINTDLMTTLSFAIMSAIFVEMWGIQSQGFFRYMSRFFTSPLKPIPFFVGLLEFIAEVARLVSFSARLFGNMLAGEILIFVMTFLVGLAAPVLIIFYGLEVFVGAIQAFVFGALTLVFAMLAIAGHDEGEHGHEEEAHGH
jgi:F-type H+-transporting ATPase subunit a